MATTLTIIQFEDPKIDDNAIYYYNQNLAQEYLQIATESLIADIKSMDNNNENTYTNLCHYNRMVKSLDALFNMNAYEKLFDFLQINDHLMSCEFQKNLREKIENCAH